ncbi:uncharacterized protein N7515_007879 [Penicillium bovifimosum]|uniref:Uncharacterized protein n=1 Tax=Penicillium bovifimosum TaxID=126998 RepID=A0A9W9GM75_9EURO|nr:uncharacterized protein N7515_007879 [Penicillium bovifimosum]KAJ5124054.1 hypothetical protein N7515_007879 [Penicillium bovifimosum]
MSFMISEPVNPPALQDHEALRRKFEENAGAILNGVESTSQVSYDCDALRGLGIVLQHFDVTDDQESPDFKPLSKEEYSTHKIDSTGIPKPKRHHYDDFDVLFNWSSSSWPLSETELICEEGFQIVRHTDIPKDYSKKDHTDITSSLEQPDSNWYQILAEHSCNDGLQGILYGLATRHSKPLGLSKWGALTWRQWQEYHHVNPYHPLNPYHHVNPYHPVNPDTIHPHVMLMICTGAVAESNNLLHGEIGTIVDAIQCRLFQYQFRHTSTFPVLVISLFGARQGRILSARFNIDGTLIVRASDTFDFKQKNQEGFDLFTRYYYSEPRDAAMFKLLLLPKSLHGPPSL